MRLVDRKKNTKNHRWSRWLALLLLLSLNLSATEFDIVKGINADGSATETWLQAVKMRNSKEDWKKLKRSKQLISATQLQWFEAIEQQLPAFQQSVSKLHLAFSDVTPLPKVQILIGNQGGNDGFTYAEDTICIDLSDWVRAYGKPDKSTRIVRILLHEYSHILTKQWRKIHDVKLDTPLERALWLLFYEGLGSYRSLSSQWFSKDKSPSALAHKTLQKLTPVFVDRMVKLKSATSDTETQLMQNMTSGSFRKQWGSLTVAIWLAQESQGDERKLAHWIAKGPEGILDLAKKYLPEAQHEQLFNGLQVTH